jgi:hypothetical protein
MNQKCECCDQTELGESHARFGVKTELYDIQDQTDYRKGEESVATVYQRVTRREMVPP